MRNGSPPGGADRPLNGCGRPRGSRPWPQGDDGRCERTGGGPGTGTGVHPQAALNAGDERAVSKTRQRDREEVVGPSATASAAGARGVSRGRTRAGRARRVAGARLRAGVHGGRGSRGASPASGSEHVSQSLVVRGGAGSIAGERPAKARLSVAGRARGGCGRGGPGRGGTRCSQRPATTYRASLPTVPSRILRAMLIIYRTPARESAPATEPRCTCVPGTSRRSAKLHWSGGLPRGSRFYGSCCGTWVQRATAKRRPATRARLVPCRRLPPATRPAAVLGESSGRHG